LKHSVYSANMPNGYTLINLIYQFSLTFFIFSDQFEIPWQTFRGLQGKWSAWNSSRVLCSELTAEWWECCLAWSRREWSDTDASDGPSQSTALSARWQTTPRAVRHDACTHSPDPSVSHTSSVTFSSPGAGPCSSRFWAVRKLYKNFCPKMQNLGLKNLLFWKRLGAKLKFLAHTISSSWNLRLKRGNSPVKFWVDSKQVDQH